MGPATPSLRTEAASVIWRRSPKGGGLLVAPRTFVAESGRKGESALRFRGVLPPSGGLLHTTRGVFGLVMAALISFGVSYLLALGLIVALLTRLFSGQVLWSLLLVGLAHLVVASALAFFAFRGDDLPPNPVLESSTSFSHPIENASPWTTTEISAN